MLGRFFRLLDLRTKILTLALPGMDVLLALLLVTPLLIRPL